MFSGWFSFSPLSGEDSHFDSYSSDGLNAPSNFEWKVHFFLGFCGRKATFSAQKLYNDISMT